MKSLQFGLGLVLLCVLAIGLAEDVKKPEAPAEGNKNAKGLFDIEDLFQGIPPLDPLDIQVGNIVNQGQSFVTQTQSVSGFNGGTKIVKTEVTHTFGNPGMRFKRDLFSTMDKIENHVEAIKDRVAGKLSDAINVGYEIREKVKEKLHGDRVRY